MACPSQSTLSVGETLSAFMFYISSSIIYWFYDISHDFEWDLLQSELYILYFLSIVSLFAPFEALLDSIHDYFLASWGFVSVVSGTGDLARIGSFGFFYSSFVSIRGSLVSIHDLFWLSEEDFSLKLKLSSLNKLECSFSRAIG